LEVPGPASSISDHARNILAPWPPAIERSHQDGIPPTPFTGDPASPMNGRPGVLPVFEFFCPGPPVGGCWRWPCAAVIARRVSELPNRSWPRALGPSGSAYRILDRAKPSSLLCCSHLNPDLGRGPVCRLFSSIRWVREPDASGVKLEIPSMVVPLFSVFSRSVVRLSGVAPLLRSLSSALLCCLPPVGMVDHHPWRAPFRR